jgi:hypothetical protein
MRATESRRRGLAGYAMKIRVALIVSVKSERKMSLVTSSYVRVYVCLEEIGRRCRLN